MQLGTDRRHPRHPMCIDVLSVAKCGEMLQIVQAIGFIGFIGCSEPLKFLKKTWAQQQQQDPKISKVFPVEHATGAGAFDSYQCSICRASCAVVLSRERGLLRTSVRDRSINGFNGFNGFVLTTSRTWSTVR